MTDNELPCLDPLTYIASVMLLTPEQETHMETLYRTLTMKDFALESAKYLRSVVDPEQLQTMKRAIWRIYARTAACYATAEAIHEWQLTATL
jgi:hypothetical protein